MQWSTIRLVSPRKVLLFYRWIWSAKWKSNNIWGSIVLFLQLAIAGGSSRALRFIRGTEAGDTGGYGQDKNRGKDSPKPKGEKLLDADQQKCQRKWWWQSFHSKPVNRVIDHGEARESPWAFGLCEHIMGIEVPTRESKIWPMTACFAGCIGIEGMHSVNIPSSTFVLESQ